MTIGEDKDFDPEGLSEEEIAILESSDDAGDETVEEQQGEALETEAKKEVTDGEAGSTGEEVEKASPAEEAPAGFVPNQALREARDEIKALKAQRYEDDAWKRQIADKLADMRNGAAQAEQTEAPPDWDTDPIARAQHVERELEAYKKAEAERQEQRDQQQQESARQQRIFDAADRKLDEIIKTDSQVGEAFQFAVNKAREGLEMQGVPPQQIDAQIQQTLMQYAHQTHFMPPNTLAAYTKELAAQMGWKPTEAPANNNTDEAKEQVEKLANAVDRNKRPSGGTSKGEMTLEDLASMSGEELEKLAENDPELFARLGA